MATSHSSRSRKASAMASHQLQRVSLCAPLCWKVSEHVACHHNLSPRQRSYNWPTGYQKKQSLVAVFWSFFFCNPNRSFIFKLGGLHPQARNHRATWLRPPQELAFIEATACPSKAQTTCPPGCWCVAPARCLGRHHRLLRLLWSNEKIHLQGICQIRVSHHASCYHEERSKGLALYRHSPIAPFPKQHLHHRPYLCQEPGERLQGGHVSVVCLKLNISSWVIMMIENINNNDAFYMIRFCICSKNWVFLTPVRLRTSICFSIASCCSCMLFQNIKLRWGKAWGNDIWRFSGKRLPLLFSRSSSMFDYTKYAHAGTHGMLLQLCEDCIPDEKHAA